MNEEDDIFFLIWCSKLYLKEHKDDLSIIKARYGSLQEKEALKMWKELKDIILEDWFTWRNEWKKDKCTLKIREKCYNKWGLYIETWELHDFDMITDSEINEIWSTYKKWLKK